MTDWSTEIDKVARHPNDVGLTREVVVKAEVREATLEDAEGNDCDILSPQATCWCAMGILFKLENTEARAGALAWRAINELNVALEGQLVHEFNDEASTANEIVALFLATANKLEARGD